MTQSERLASLARGALAKCVTMQAPTTHDGGRSNLRRLTPGESAALLAVAGECHALRLCSLRLMRQEAARLEKDHAAAVAFGSGGSVGRAKEVQ